MTSGAVDVGDAILAPGFVDIQINGIGDVDFNDCDVAGYARAAARLLSHGVTTFIPTLISAPMDSYEAKLDVLEEAGAFGIHLEGPFLGGAPGAHRREHVREADLGWMSSLLDRHPGLIRIVTLAPESDPALSLTRMLTDAGVIVSLGHSTASFEESVAATDAGARAVTHLFNGMAPLHHREPGLAGAALDDVRLTPSLIADLIHVHPVALRLAAARKPNVALVSDAIAINGRWAASRGIREIDGAPRLENGTLAGSVLTLDRAVQNMVAIGVERTRAIDMATTVPAELLGIESHDQVALDPVDLSVRAVWKDSTRVV